MERPRRSHDKRHGACARGLVDGEIRQGFAHPGNDGSAHSVQWITIGGRTGDSWLEKFSGQLGTKGDALTSAAIKFVQRAKWRVLMPV